MVQSSSPKKDEGTFERALLPVVRAFVSRRTKSSGDKAGVPCSRALSSVYCPRDNSFPPSRKGQNLDSGDRRHTLPKTSFPSIRRAPKSVSDWSMTLPHDRRSTGADRRALLERRLGMARTRRQPESDRRINGDRRSGQERRLAILSAEDQIRESLRLLTLLVEEGHPSETEQRRLESAMLRLRFALDRLEQ